MVFCFIKKNVLKWKLYIFINIIDKWIVIEINVLFEVYKNFNIVFLILYIVGSIRVDIFLIC